MKTKSILQDQFGDQIDIDLNLLPNTPSILQWLYAKPMKRGLDLRGGVHLLLEVDTSQNQTQKQNHQTIQWLENLKSHKVRYTTATPTAKGVKLIFNKQEEFNKARSWIQNNMPGIRVETQEKTLTLTPHQMAVTAQAQYLIKKTVESINRRVNELGLSEAIVTQQGEQHISVDIPGTQDINQAKALIGNTASLSFHIVNNIAQEAKDLDPSQAEYHVKSDQGYHIEIAPTPLLTGDAITFAAASQQEGKPVIQVELNSDASQRFHQATQANIGKQLAIVLTESKANGQQNRQIKRRIISAPVIQDALKHSFVISGSHNHEEAETLAMLLRSGSLAAPVDIVSQTTIGPSLGADNIQKGILSIGIGLVAIMAFMVVYYRTFGIIANLALVLNLLIMMTLLSWLEATLTLPAMAAIILSVGMAVDANVLINERIREELKAGVQGFRATVLGYEKAFSSIFDANITTMIVALILYVFSTGMVKGFAITLMIGLISAMYTSVYVTKILTFLCLPYMRAINKAIGA